MLKEEVDVELLREVLTDSVTLTCPTRVALPLVVCVMFAAGEFDWGFARVVFWVRVMLDCIERTVELLFDVALVAMGPVCSTVPVIEPVSASEAREDSLLAGETKTTL